MKLFDMIVFSTISLPLLNVVERELDLRAVAAVKVGRDLHVHHLTVLPLHVRELVTVLRIH